MPLYPYQCSKEKSLKDPKISVPKPVYVDQFTLIMNESHLES